MKVITTLLVICASFVFYLSGFAQTEHEMKEGEVMKFDAQGNSLDHYIIVDPTAKKSPDIVTQNPNKVSDYHDNGRLKIPGYIPSDIQSVDEQNYKKAKYNFYTNNPDEYKKWVEQHSQPISKITISQEEFDSFPVKKKEIILADPVKYEIK